MSCAYWFGAPPGVFARSASPTFRMFSKPSSATVTIRASLHTIKSHSGLIAPLATRYEICWCVPPDVAFDTAHAASFLMSNSECARR